MEATPQPKLTVDEFSRGHSGAEEHYELINGVAYVMAGAKEGHNVICSNVLVSSSRPERKAAAARHPAILRSKPAWIRFMRPGFPVDFRTRLTFCLSVGQNKRAGAATVGIGR